MYETSERGLAAQPRRPRVRLPGSCQVCGSQAPTKYVEFYLLVGMVIVFVARSIRGHLCKACIHRYFRDYTLGTLCLGWLGCISMVLTPFVLLHNIIRYVCCLRMPAVAKGPARRSASAPSHKIKVIWELPGGSSQETGGQDASLPLSRGPDSASAPLFVSHLVPPPIGNDDKT